MAEHEHHMHEDGHVIHISPPPKLVALIVCSIVLAAVIVGGSIVYGSRYIGQQLNNSLLVKQAVIQPSAAGTQAAVPTPTGPVNLTARANQPTLGNKDAKITLVEFGDFQCPFCKQFFQQAFGQIKKQYVDTGKIKYIFRHFPLTQIHVNAQISGIAAECANSQGKFWEYHDLLYAQGQSDGTNLAAADLKKYADQLGLNKGVLGLGKNKFNQCLDAKNTEDIVNKDEQLGANLGIGGTPTFVLLKNANTEIDTDYVRAQTQARQNVIKLTNGNVVIVGSLPLIQFQQALDDALK